MAARREEDASGCAVLFVGLLIIAAVVAAVISLAAIVDPFSWMPPVGEVWEDCSDDYDTETDECALANRFPGFWWHAAVNLLYMVVVGILVVLLVAAVADFREARAARFDGPEAAGRYAAARPALALLVLLMSACGMVPILVAAL